MKLYVLSALLIFSSFAMAQSNEVSDPQLTFEQYCLNEAITYINIPAEKMAKAEFDGELNSLEATSGATYEDYGVELLEDRTQYFKLVGSDKFLAVKSLYQLRLSYSNIKQ